jgi:DNA-binding NtrC family response regulator
MKTSLPIGDSPAMRSLRVEIARAAAFDEPVLLLGETGTGKELVARCIHERSLRGALPLQVIQCAGIGADMLTAELFGHRAGSFTGAAGNRAGRIRAAAGSTILLDEISETPGSFQAAVLRAIDLGEVQPVGMDETVHVDARFVATSNRPIEELAEGGDFRLDLFHRLAAFVIRIPPLRDRPEDIGPLAEHLLAQLANRYGEPRKLADGALGRLRHHDFPGNVRELRQILVRAYAHTPTPHIGRADVAAAIISPGDIAANDGSRPAEDLSLQEAIRGHIRRALLVADGNLAEAARRLQIPRSTLQHYLVKYRVDERADAASDSDTRDGAGDRAAR